MECHPLLDEQHITFAGFIDMLMTFTDDTIEVIAKYLIDSNDFLQLDYYCAAYRNDKPTAILFKFDENGNDEPPSYPTKDYLQELIDGEIRINDADEYGWLVSDILNITAIKDIGLNDKAFTVLRYGESVNATSMIELENTRIRAAQLTFANERAHAQIAELESKLAQAKAELADRPADEDKELNTKSQNYAAKIVLAMAQIADLNLDSPYASKEPNTTNSIIFDQIKTNGMKVSNQVIGNWLKLATEQTKDD